MLATLKGAHPKGACPRARSACAPARSPSVWQRGRTPVSSARAPFPKGKRGRRAGRVRSAR